jgi:hypothetical protein
MRALRIPMILVALAVIASSCGSTPTPVAAPPRSTATSAPAVAPPTSSPTPVPTAAPPTSSPAPTATAAPPTVAPTPPFTLATPVKDVVGIWHSAGKSIYLRFYEDGTPHQSHSLDGLNHEPYAKSKVWFEGTQMFLKETAVSGVPPCGATPAIYEARLLPEGRIRLVKI